jgi:alanyl-tRNA synthetase
MGDAYPKLRTDEARITAVLKAEEERFFETLEIGMTILDTALAGGAKVLPGDVAFKLHDTYGFPLDLSADVCRERGVRSTRPASSRHGQAEEPGRAAGKFKMDRALEYTGGGNLHRLRTARRAAKVVALYADGVAVQASTPARAAWWCWTPRLSTPRAAARSATRACITGRRVHSRWTTRSRSRPTCSATTARRKRAR